MVMQRIILIAILLSVVAEYAFGCHHLRKRDLTTSSSYFPSCLVYEDSSLPHLIGSVKSVVDFVVDESQWYESTLDKCKQKDLYLETSCWREEVKSLIVPGSPAYDPTKICLCEHIEKPSLCKSSGKHNQAIQNTNKDQRETALNNHFSSCLWRNFKLENNEKSQYNLSSVTIFLTDHSTYTRKNGDRVDNIITVYEKILKSNSQYRNAFETCKEKLLKYRQRIYEPYSLSNWSECSVLCGEGVQTRKKTCEAFSCYDAKGQETSRPCDGKYPRCHLGMYYSRKKRNVVSISTYFPSCVVGKNSSLPNLVDGSVSSTVGFLVDQSEWYDNTSILCNNSDLSVETSCWRSEVRSLILSDSPFFDPTMNCVCDYAGNPSSCTGSGRRKREIQQNGTTDAEVNETLLNNQFSSFMEKEFELKNDEESEYNFHSVTLFLTDHSVYTSEGKNRVDNIIIVYEKTLKKTSRYRSVFETGKKKLEKYRKRIYEPYSLSEWSECYEGVQTKTKTCEAFECYKPENEITERQCGSFE